MSLVHSPQAAHTQPGSAKTVADILTAAADLIEPEGAWTQDDFARNAGGRARASGAPDAVCWCVLGAIQRVEGSFRYVAEARDALVSVVGPDLADWNDAPERTQAEVVAALRAAAEKARTAAASSVGTARSDVQHPDTPATGGVQKDQPGEVR